MTAAIGAAWTTCSFASIDFREIAPADTTTILVIDDFSSLEERFEASGLKEAWDDPRMQSWFDGMMEEMLAEYGQDLDDLGIDVDEMKMPEGQVGMAWWMTTDEDDYPVPQMLIAADFGGNADDMEEMLMSALEKAGEQELLEVEENEYLDHEIMSLHPIEEEDGDDWDDWDDDWGDDGGGMLPGPLAGLMPDMSSVEEMHVVRAGDVIFMCTDLEGLEGALDRHEGDGDGSLADNEDLGEAVNRLGDADAWVVMFGGDLDEMLPADQMMMMGDMMKDLGVDQIRTVGIGAHLESDRGMAEITGHLISDGKDGILSLMDLDAVPFDPPAFVGADATKVTALQFGFNEMMEMVKDALNSMAEQDDGMGMAAMIDQQVRMIEPAVRQMGPDVYMIESIQRPYSIESQQGVTVIRTKDAEAVAGVIDTLSMMMGLEARDFQGNQIWSTGEGGFVPLEIAMGLGSGYLFVGPEDLVENGLRAAGQEGAVSIADEESFQAAAKAIDQRGVMYMYTNSVAALPYTKWLKENFADELRAMMIEEMGEIQPWQEEMIADNAAAMEAAPPVEAIMDHIGNTILEVTSEDDGYAMRMVVLEP